MIYLASPYTGNEEENYQAMLGVVAAYVDQGKNVYSPILHYHHVAKRVTADWLSLDLQVLELCTELHVIKLPGYEVSKGILVEVIAAKKMGILVTLVEVE